MYTSTSVKMNKKKKKKNTTYIRIQFDITPLYYVANSVVRLKKKKKKKKKKNQMYILAYQLFVCVCTYYITSTCNKFYQRK